MKPDLSKFTLRTDPDLLLKFHYVAKYSDRSSNQELGMLMKKHVADFESKVGPIPSDWMEAKRRSKH